MFRGLIINVLTSELNYKKPRIKKCDKHVQLLNETSTSISSRMFADKKKESFLIKEYIAVNQRIDEK